MSNTGLIRDSQNLSRCSWCGNDPLYQLYHDEEWGRPVSNDVQLFEKICLEGFQAGLSWITILRKRENFREAFLGFDFYKVALFTDKDVERLLKNEGIIRHRGKIEATINNAQKIPDIIDEYGSFAHFLWQYEPDSKDRPTQITHKTLQTITQSAESERLSKDLKKRGFKFVGPTTMYAFMQAMGLVNDHIEGCHIRSQVEQDRKTFQRP